MAVLVADGLGDDLEEVLSLGLLLIGECFLQDGVDGGDVESLHDSSLGLFGPLIAHEDVRDGHGGRLEVVLTQDVDHFVPELVDVLTDLRHVVLGDAAARGHEDKREVVWKKAFIHKTNLSSLLKT